MGREIKRVDPAFDWPMSVRWGGFINPYYSQKSDCPDCGGTGSSPEGRHLTDQWYGKAPFDPESRGSTPYSPDHPAIRSLAERNVGHAPGFYGEGEHAIAREARRLCGHFNSHWSYHLNADDVAALIKADRLYDLTHTFTPGKGWERKDPPHVPTPQEVNEWSLSGMGHDSINQWVVTRTECERLGVDTQCHRCNGEGDLWPTEAIRQQCEAWEETPPPAGTGWQVWETVSEGSPVTPAFETPTELVDYLVEYGDHWDQKRGDGGWRREVAERFVRDGWAASMIATAGKVLMPRDGQSLSTEGVTWCQDRINDSDVEYVRADTVTPEDLQ